MRKRVGTWFLAQLSPGNYRVIAASEGK